MCLCRVLDACGLCVLPSGVAALTSLTKLCVLMQAAQQTPLKPQAASGWSVVACSSASHKPWCPVLIPAGGCLTMACVSCQRRLGACRPWSPCESTQVLGQQSTQLCIVATSCVLQQPVTAHTCLLQHLGISRQQPGKELHAVIKRHKSLRNTAAPTAQEPCLSCTHCSVGLLPRWLGSNLLQTLPAGISRLTSLKQL